MTVKIKKSLLDAAPDFGATVAAHAHAMSAWRAHMARVQQDSKDPGIPPLQRHQPYDQPHAHELVERAVNESDEVDYEVEDDGPDAATILRAKKNELFSRVYHAEVAAIEKVAPMAKRRFQNLIENDIREEDAKRGAEAFKEKVGLLSAVGLGRSKTPPEVLDEVAKSRKPSHQKHLDEQDARRSKIRSIEVKAAQAQNDIEDLTIENIDAWVMPDFT